MNQATGPTALADERVRLAGRLSQEGCGHQRLQHGVARVWVESKQAAGLRLRQVQTRHLPVFGLDSAHPVGHRARFVHHVGSVRSRTTNTSGSNGRAVRQPAEYGANSQRPWMNGGTIRAGCGNPTVVRRSPSPSERAHGLRVASMRGCRRASRSLRGTRHPRGGSQCGGRSKPSSTNSRARHPPTGHVPGML